MEPLVWIPRDRAYLPGSVQGPLLLELAQLEWLEELFLEHSTGHQWATGVPVEWCRPGAFPRLKQ